MNTARPVPRSPPIAFVTGRRRISRSAAIRSWMPTATAAAGSRPAMALTVTNATGPTPVSTIARRSRSMSSGLAGSSGRGSSLSGSPSGSALGLGGRKHQVVEELRRKAALEQAPVDALQQQVAPVGVVDPRHRDPLGVRAGLQRAVEPAEPVRQQLLAAHPDLLEARAGGVALEVGGHE